MRNHKIQIRHERSDGFDGARSFANLRLSLLLNLVLLFIHLFMLSLSLSCTLCDLIFNNIER